MIDPEEFGKAMGALIKEATAPLLRDIEGLKKQLSELRIPTEEDVAELVDIEAIAKSAAALVPIPEVKDGNSVSMDDDVLPVLKILVRDALEALPKPEKGQDADMPALKAHLDEMVKTIQPAAPLPAPTVDEVAAAFERRFSDLTLSWERQARDTFEKAADRMPKPENGRDAIPLEGFDLTLAEDGRTVTVKMQAGETVIEKSVKIGAVIDRGTYKHEGQYEKGDGTSYGGSYWIAKCDNPQGVPGTGETDWRCAVKKGRDGKDLRENASTIDPKKGVSIR